jgi:DNA-binding MarR family transcriptional regulator
VEADESVTRREAPDAAPARSPEGEAFGRLAFAVLRLSGLLNAAGDAMAAPAGQTSARWQVLAAIEEAPATVAQIARNLGLARQSVQRVADLLVRDSAAAYDENPNHKRASLLRITPRGLRALREIQSHQREWAEQLGREIGAADLKRASAVIERMTEAVSRQLPEE